MSANLTIADKIKYYIVGTMVGMALKYNNFANNYRRYGIPDVKSKGDAERYQDAPIKHFTHSYRGEKLDVLLFELIDMSIYPRYKRTVFTEFDRNTGSYYLRFDNRLKYMFVSLDKDTLIDLIPAFINERIDGGKYQEYLGSISGPPSLKKWILNRIILMFFIKFYNSHLSLFFDLEGGKKYLRDPRTSAGLHFTTGYFANCGVNLIKSLGIDVISNKKSKYNDVQYVGSQIKLMRNPSPAMRRDRHLRKLFGTSMSYIGAIPFFRSYPNIETADDIGSLQFDISCVSETEFQLLQRSTSPAQIYCQKNGLSVPFALEQATGPLFPDYMTAFLTNDKLCELYTDIANFLSSGMLNAMIQFNNYIDLRTGNANLSNGDSFVSSANVILSETYFLDNKLNFPILDGLDGPILKRVYLVLFGEGEYALEDFKQARTSEEIELIGSYLVSHGIDINPLFKYIQGVLIRVCTGREVISKEALGSYVHILNTLGSHPKQLCRQKCQVPIPGLECATVGGRSAPAKWGADGSAPAKWGADGGAKRAEVLLERMGRYILRK